MMTLPSCFPGMGKAKESQGKQGPHNTCPSTYLYLHFFPSEHALNDEFCTHTGGSSSDLSLQGTVSSLTTMAACLLTVLPPPAAPSLAQCVEASVSELTDERTTNTPHVGEHCITPLLNTGFSAIACMPGF